MNDKFEDIERCVVGGMLMDGDFASRMVELGLTEEYFVDRRLKIIMRSITRCSTASVIDSFMITADLNDHNKLEASGGYDFLLELMDKAVVTSGHSEFYFTKLKKFKIYRDSIAILRDSLSCIQSSPIDEVKCVIESSMSMLSNVDKEVFRNITTEEIIEKVMNGRQDSKLLIPMPFDSENEYVNGGLKTGYVYVFTGESGAGKSYFKATWLNKLGELGIPTLDVCIEDGKEVTLGRRAGQISKLNSVQMIQGFKCSYINGRQEIIETTMDQRERFAKALRKADAMPIIHDGERVDANGLRAKVAKYKRTHNISVVFIDGMKDLARPSGTYNDTGYDEELSQATTAIARDFDVAIFAVYHLTKSFEEAQISKARIRGSGQIFSDCRGLFALQSRGLVDDAARDGVIYNMDNNNNPILRRFDCLKYQFGDTFHTWVEPVFRNDSMEEMFV